MLHLTPETINAYLDAALSTSEHAAVEQHLAACPACAQELAALQAVFARLQTWPPQPTPRNFAAAITQKLRAQATVAGATPPVVWPAYWRVALALQALVAIGVLSFFATSFFGNLAWPTLPALWAWPTLPNITFPDVAQQWANFGQGLAPTTSTLTWVFSLTALSLAWLLGSGWLLRTLQNSSPQRHNPL